MVKWNMSQECCGLGECEMHRPPDQCSVSPEMNTHSGQLHMDMDTREYRSGRAQITLGFFDSTP